ncbi:hypothetical protein CAPTEDRAFT_190163 [Capitella teleta]|uniref:Uncharacterized protein n=1 Tax=Capitella teleta TaxID=283909 RepID=R7UL20_CAPTE|nr:hypothetical protein CAPTEDRAFT_190163 [Capitella teleta]|eukprot:ELU07239.1 hypothetical protein CAPTEDRAFT_190163 [Capitella teleta]
MAEKTAMRLNDEKREFVLGLGVAEPDQIEGDHYDNQEPRNQVKHTVRVLQEAPSDATNVRASLVIKQEDVDPIEDNVPPRHNMGWTAAAAATELDISVGSKLRVLEMQEEEHTLRMKMMNDEMEKREQEHALKMEILQQQNIHWRTRNEALEVGPLHPSKAAASQQIFQSPVKVKVKVKRSLLASKINK